MHTRGGLQQHGKLYRVVERVDQPEAGDGQVRAQWGGGEARKTREAGVMLV